METSAKSVLETDKYRLRFLSREWKGPVVLYITSDRFGEDCGKLMREVEQRVDVPFSFCALEVHDWDRYLTPWEADAGMNGRSFPGQARELLQSLENEALPLIRTKAEEEDVFLAGYSLAGLFSLWCTYESDAFAGAACCSGSVWYPGWKEFAINHSLRRKSRIYLSLGKKEKNTKNPFMKTVEDNMKQQYELLSQDTCCEYLTLNWHEGGHFCDTEERMCTGIARILSGK